MTDIDEKDVVVRTSRGEMTVQVFSPASGTPRSAVILYMDAPGIREELFDVCRRIAGRGHICLLPDLYYHIGLIRIDLTRRTPAFGPIYHALASSLTEEAVRDDTDALIRVLDDSDATLSVYCLGYSTGARFALQVPAWHPGRIRGVHTVCGVELVTEEETSPHLALDQAEGTAFTMDFAADDPKAPPAMISALGDAMTAHDLAHDILVHPGTRHGFTFPMRPMYDPDAAELAWSRFFGMLDQSNTH